MFKYSIKESKEITIKNIIEIVRESKINGIGIAKKSNKRTVWYFSSKTNRFIPFNIVLEISTNKFYWPSLCVIKENGIARGVIPSKKISFFQKMKLFSVLRKFSKNIQPENDIANLKIEEDYGYKGFIFEDELEYIEYQQQEYGT